MRARLPALVLGVLAATSAIGAAPASAAIVEPIGSPASATSGIAFGDDGNLWVAEAFNDALVRISPEGQFLQRFALGGAPTNVTTGPGGKVWVAVTGAKKLAFVVATDAAPALTSISTAGLSNCGPVGLTSGGDGRIYFSMPNDGSAGCTNPSRISSVSDTGTGAPAPAVSGGGGAVFDLAVSGGKLFAPDFDGDVIRRLTLGTTPTVEAQLPGLGSGPDGITVDGSGTLWATGLSTGQVLRFTPTSATPVAVLGVPGAPPNSLVSAFGIVAGPDGRIYVAGGDSQNLLRLNADGTGATYFPLPADSRPWQLALAPGGDLFVTDLNKPRVLRFVNTAPRATTGAAVASGQTSGSASATVDPRGNETQVVFDYGTTTAYGQTTAPTTIPAGTAPVPVSAALAGLAAGTGYHVRVRATSGEGSTTGADLTFITPIASDVLPPAKLAKVKAKVSFTSKAKSTTVISSLRLNGLTGGETATILCSGSKKCPFSKKTYKKLKAGTKTFGKSLWKGRALPKGAKVTVRLELPGFLSTSTVLTVRRNKKPTTASTCLTPGTTTKTSCG